MGNAKRVLNWGILSTATINRSLIPAIRESNGNNVFAIASRKYETAIKFAKKWDVQKVFKSYSELLDDSEIDVVYVPLPNSMHAEWAVKAMKAGKHVLCEKPLALSTVQVDDMTRVAHENGVVLSEALMYRHSNEVLEVKKLIEDGAIGSLCFVRGGFRVNTNYSVDNIRFHG